MQQFTLTPDDVKFLLKRELELTPQHSEAYWFQNFKNDDALLDEINDIGEINLQFYDDGTVDIVPEDAWVASMDVLHLMQNMVNGLVTECVEVFKNGMIDLSILDNAEVSTE